MTDSNVVFLQFHYGLEVSAFALGDGASGSRVRAWRAASSRRGKKAFFRKSLDACESAWHNASELAVIRKPRLRLQAR